MMNTENMFFLVVGSKGVRGSFWFHFKFKKQVINKSLVSRHIPSGREMQPWSCQLAFAVQTQLRGGTSRRKPLFAVAH